jgi:hypothetical protein
MFIRLFAYVLALIAMIGLVEARRIAPVVARLPPRRFRHDRLPHLDNPALGATHGADTGQARIRGDLLRRQDARMFRPRPKPLNRCT